MQHSFMGSDCCEDGTDRFIPNYATIISRGGYLGLTAQNPGEDYSGFSKREFHKLIRVKLAGRAVELMYHEEKAKNEGLAPTVAEAKALEYGLTTGASNDLMSATVVAGNMICIYGMQDGRMAFLQQEIILKSPMVTEYLNSINDILNKEMKNTISIIRENCDKVKALADELIDRSRLDTEDMIEILDKCDKQKKKDSR